MDDINKLNSQLDEEEEYPVTILDEEPFIQPEAIEQQKAVVLPTDWRDAKEKELQRRRLEMAVWAEKNQIANKVPSVRQLEIVKHRIKRGWTLLASIKGICTYATWCKWRKEYPEIADMEEDARAYRAEYLQGEMRRIADRPDRTKMGETARDRLMVEIRQKEVERIDRLTEIRMGGTKQTSPIVPIQINVGYGKDGTEPKP